jgi:thioredoxin 1
MTEKRLYAYRKALALPIGLLMICSLQGRYADKNTELYDDDFDRPSAPAPAKTAPKKQQHGGVQEIKSASDYKEAIESDKPVIIDIWTTWCEACKMYKEPFSRVASEYGEDADFYSLNPELNEDFRKFVIKELNGIEAFPTTVYIKKGSIVDKKRGSFEYEGFKKHVRTFLGLPREQEKREEPQRGKGRNGEGKRRRAPEPCGPCGSSTPKSKTTRTVSK